MSLFYLVGSKTVEYDRTQNGVKSVQTMEVEDLIAVFDTFDKAWNYQEGSNLSEYNNSWIDVKSIAFNPLPL